MPRSSYACDDRTRALARVRLRAWTPTIVATCVVLVVLAFGAVQAHAASTVILPNGVATDSGSFVVSGCSAPKSNCIDEAVPGSVNDADALNVTVAGPVSITFDLATVANAFRVQALEISYRARCVTGGATGSIGVGIYNASNVQQGTTTNTPTTSAWTNYVSVQQSLSINQATLDGLRFRITTGACTSGAISVSAASIRVIYPVVASEVLIPNGDRTAGGLVQECAPSYSCIDDRLSGPIIDPNPDGDAIGHGPAPGCWGGGGAPTPTYYLSDMPAITSESLSVQFHVRGRQSTPFNGSDTNLQLFDASDNPLTAVGTALMDNTGWIARITPEQNVTVAPSVINNAYVAATIIHTSCSRNYLSALNVIVKYAEQQLVTGTALNAPGGTAWSRCDGVTTNVTVRSMGVSQNVACDTSTGAYSARIDTTANSVVAAYLNDPTPANNGGVAYTKVLSKDTDSANLDIVRGEARVRSDSLALSVQPADLAAVDSTFDPDIPVTASGSSLAAAPGTTLVVTEGTLDTTGADVSAPRMRIDSGAVWNSTIANTLTLSGSGTGACSAGASARPFCQMAATGTPGAINVTHTGTSALEVDGTPLYYDLRLRPASGAPTYQLGSSSDATLVVLNALEIGTGGAAMTASTTAYSPTLSVSNGSTTIAAAATLSGNGSGTLMFAGNLSGSGNVNLTAGIVELRSTTSTTLDAGGTLPGTAWQFATLILANSHAVTSRNVTIPVTSREIRASTLLRIGTASDSANTALLATATTRPITVTGNFEISSRGVLNAPPLLEVQGNITNASAWNGGTGELRVSGAGTTTVSSTGSGSVYNLNVSTPSKVIDLSTNFKVTNLMTLAGGSCATPVTLRSSSLGAQRIIDTAGATVSVTLTSLRDVSFTTSVVPISAGDLGGNANVTFPDANCTAPSLPYVDPTNAAAGATRPTNIDGSGAFHMSFRNETGTAADRYRSAVMTSPVDATVRGLFALDGNGTDRALGNTATGTAPAYVTSATNFGQAGDFDGVDDVLAAPSNPASYDASSFTVETWIRASGPSANATPTIVSRASSATSAQFRIWIDTASGMLRGGASAGGTMYSTATSASPWLDDQWHHVALTVDGAKRIRLYLDGSQYGATVTHPGTLDQPAAPLRIGGGWGAGTYFDGMIDDVRFSHALQDTDGIRGFMATGRPHGTTLWSSTNYATNGAALAVSCTTATRCSDIVYAGPNIHRAGARYFVNQMVRTTGGLWSAATSDWFETADQISISLPATATPPTVAPLSDSTTSISVVTTCGHASGCELQLSAPSDTAALSHASTSDTVAPFTTGTTNLWAAGAPLGFGVTILSSTSGKDTTRWGTGTNFASLPALRFLGLNRTPSLGHETTSTGTETTVIGLRLNVPATKPTGSYSGVINVTSVPNT